MLRVNSLNPIEQLPFFSSILCTMGNNTSSQVSFRNIINEIKFGDDICLVDPYENGPGRDYASTSVTSKNMVEYFAKEKPVYKTIFLTQLSNEDMAAFINFDDIRFLRRHRPNQLALILYKCMQQLHFFVLNHNTVSDHTAVRNSLRILSNAMPYLIEDIDIEVTKPEPCDFNCPLFGARERMWLTHTSIYGKDFFRNFFWKNLACSGETIHETDSSSNITVTVPLSHSKAFQNGSPLAPLPTIESCPQLPPIDPNCGGIPFAQLLVRLFTDCCFIPYFTVNGAQVVLAKDEATRTSNEESIISSKYPSSRAVEAFIIGKAASNVPSGGSQSIAEATFVCSQLMWYDGAFVVSAADKANTHLAKSYSRAITNNRILMLRCILSLMIERVIEGHIPASYAAARRDMSSASGCLYLSDLFVSAIHNPLGPTLCASLLNYIANYQTKGTLPWTSYVGADIPEQQLALATQVLNAALDFDIRISSSGVPFMRPSAATSTDSTNSFWAIVDSIACSVPTCRGLASAADSIDKNYRKRLATSIITIVANPLYALHRRIENSQKRVLCYLEVLHLLLRLLLGAGNGGYHYQSSLIEQRSAAYSLNHIREEFTSIANAPELVEALLFFIYNGGLHHKFFAEVQVVMFILRVLVEGDAAVESTGTTSSLSYVNHANKGFVTNFLLRNRLQTPYQIRPHVLGLSFVLSLDSSTNADIVLLSMCSMLSEATPRWYLGLAPSAAAIIRHLCGIVAECQGPKSKVIASTTADEVPSFAFVTLFELRHSFDFVSNRNFLRKGDMAFQAAQLMIESLILLITGGNTLELRGKASAISANAYNEHDEGDSNDYEETTATRLLGLSTQALQVTLSDPTSQRPPSGAYVNAVGPLAASLGTSEGAASLLKEWYGVSLGSHKTQKQSTAGISVANDEAEMERKATIAAEDAKGTKLIAKTELQRAIVKSSREAVEALFVLCNNVLKPVVIAALQQSNADKSSTAGGNDVMVEAKDIRVAFPAAIRALSGVLGISHHEEQQTKNSDLVMPAAVAQGPPPTTADAPPMYSHLLSLPIALWLSQAMWTVTQTHNLRPSVLFDGRSSYMFLGSAKFYGDKVEEKVARAKGENKTKLVEDGSNIHQ